MSLKNLLFIKFILYLINIKFSVKIKFIFYLFKKKISYKTYDFINK